MKRKAVSGNQRSGNQRSGRRNVFSRLGGVVPPSSGEIGERNIVQGSSWGGSQRQPTKSSKKNARKNKSRKLVADSNSTPNVQAYIICFFHQVIPIPVDSVQETSILFSTLMENAKLFFVQENSPDIMTKVYADDGTFHASFLDSCIVRLQKLSHLCYISKKRVDNGVAVVKGKFIFEAWKRGAILPRSTLTSVLHSSSQQQREVTEKEKSYLRLKAAAASASSPAASASSPAALALELDSHACRMGAMQVELEQQAQETSRLESELAEAQRQSVAHQLVISQQQRAPVVTQAEPSVPLVAQFQPSQAGIYIVGIILPHGLYHCADIVGVTHAFIAPSLLNLPPQSRLVTEVHDFALIIGFEAHEHTPMELGCVIINREYEIVGEYCRTASPATAPSIKGAFSYALTGLALSNPVKRSDTKGAVQMQTFTSQEQRQLKSSFETFVRATVGPGFSNIQLFGKAVEQEQKCLRFMGYPDLAGRIQDLYPNGRGSPAFPFTSSSAGPGSNWLKHGDSERIVGQCTAHSAMCAGGNPFNHCALADCRSYAKALKMYANKCSDPSSPGVVPAPGWNASSKRPSSSQQQRTSSAQQQGGTSSQQQGSSRSSHSIIHKRPSVRTDRGDVTSGMGARSVPPPRIFPVRGFKHLCAEKQHELAAKLIDPADVFVTVDMEYYLRVPEAQKMLHIALGSDVRTPCVRLPFMSLDTDDGTVLRGVLKESILGTGAFGQVMECYWKGPVSQDEKLVIKLAKKTFLKKEVAASVLAHDASIVHCFGHNSCTMPGGVDSVHFMIFRRMQCSLFAYGLHVDRRVKRFWNFSKRDMILVIHAVAASLTHLHDVLRVVHRDLHEANILVEYDNAGITRVCLADLGRIQEFPDDEPLLLSNPEVARRGSLPHYAPEINNRQAIGAHTDVFGYIILFLHMFSGHDIWKRTVKELRPKRDVETCIRDKILGIRACGIRSKKYRAAVKLLTRGINGTEQQRRDITVSHAREAMVNLVDAMLPQSKF